MIISTQDSVQVLSGYLTRIGFVALTMFTHVHERFFSNLILSTEAHFQTALSALSAVWTCGVRASCLKQKKKKMDVPNKTVPLAELITDSTEPFSLAVLGILFA